MSEEKKTIELKDNELEKVSGGLRHQVGDGFIFSDAWPTSYEGEWFMEYGVYDFAYNVCSAGDFNFSFIANKYWYKDGEAWPYGTCSFNYDSSLFVIETPTVIHDNFTGDKPF